MIYRLLIVLTLLLCSCQSHEETIEWVTIPAGEFTFGSNEGRDNESPEVLTLIETFKISKSEVSNKQFAQFVSETNYTTQAEKNSKGSFTFDKSWKINPQANWRTPNGLNDSYKSILDHPVVHVTINDALAYCKWANCRLPSEIEWEYAANIGSKKDETFNIWSGDFPQKNNANDGYLTTAPNNAYKENSFGLLNMKGNVWEICSDIYHHDIHEKRELSLVKSPYQGPQYNPIKEIDDTDTNYVMKGGSFLCHSSYCAGYRPEARQSVSQNESYSHIGFRVAKNITQ